MTRKMAELYSIIRGFIERGLCGDNAREASFQTLDAFESAIREDALQQAVIDIARVRSEGVAEGAEKERERIRELAMPVERNFLGLPSLIIPVSVFNEPASVLNPTKEAVRVPTGETWQEVQWLRSDIATLERLLAELPADHVIERMGFESKKKEEEERLAVLAPTKESER